MSALEAALRKHLGDGLATSVSSTLEGPDSAGFYLAAVSLDLGALTVHCQGTSRSPASALAYALEEAAQQLLGKRAEAPRVPAA